MTEFGDWRLLMRVTDTVFFTSTAGVFRPKHVQLLFYLRRDEFELFRLILANLVQLTGLASNPKNLSASAISWHNDFTRQV